MEKRIVERKKWQFGLVICFFLASFFFSIEVSAQYYPPLVDNAEAQTMLNDEIPGLIAYADAVAPGTPDHKLAVRKANLFNHTWESLSEGESLETALARAYGEFALDVNGNSGSEDELAGMDVNKSNPDYGDPAFNDLVNFLRQ